MSKIALSTTPIFHANYDPPEGVETIINRGGTSSGKTIAILQAIFVTLHNDPGSLCTVVGQDIPNLKVGAMRDCENIIASSPLIKSFLYGPFNKSDKFYRFKSGSMLEFKSYEDEQDAKNGKRQYAFFNEVNGVKKGIFTQVQMRTSKVVWMDFNPSSDFWLMEDHWEQRPGVRTVVSTYRNNRFIDPSVRRRIESYEPTEKNIRNGTANEYLWKVYGLGEFAPLEGAIFTNWKRGTWDNSLPYIYGVDWGTSDPTVLLKVAINEKSKKIYIQQLIYKPTKSASEIKKLFTAHVPNREDLMIADSSELHIINELRTKQADGVWFNCQPAFKRGGIVKERIKWINDYQIILCGPCPDVEKELNNYVWADTKAKLPIDLWNHAMDALGYVMTYWRLNVVRGRS